jgi:hypothetical protein
MSVTYISELHQWMDIFKRYAVVFMHVNVTNEIVYVRMLHKTTLIDIFKRYEIVYECYR